MPVPPRMESISFPRELPSAVGVFPAAGLMVVVVPLPTGIGAADGCAGAVAKKPKPTRNFLFSKIIAVELTGDFEASAD